MSEHIRMTRIDIGDAAWRRFHAQCIEQGLEIPAALGAIVRAAVLRREKRRARWLQEKL